MTRLVRFRSGSGVPLVTPLREGSIDDEAVGRLVEFQIRAGTKALIICGSTGENQALSFKERAHLIRVALDAARGQIAVIAATGCETHAETIALSAYAENAGADGLLIITPRATAASQDGVVAYFSDLAERTALPVYVYNYPPRTQIDITASTLERLVLARPNIAGLKQTDANLRLVTQVRRRLGPDFFIFVGIEQLALAGLALGAAGMITASANIVPQQLAEMFEAFTLGRIDEARRLHDSVSELFDAVVYAESSPAAALKYLLRRTGYLLTNEHRLPSMPPTPSEEEQLDAVFADVAPAAAARN